MEDDDEDENLGCVTMLCTKKNSKSHTDKELDGFIAFMQRKEPSSNPALRGDLSMLSTKGETRQGNKASTRDDRANKIHVVESVYYSVVKGTDRSKWKEYQPENFKAVKIHMARGSCSQIHLLQHIPSGYMGVMKVMPPNKQHSAEMELAILAECGNSPFILQLIDAFTHTRTSYLFLEYAPFRTLDDLAMLTEGVGSEKCMLFGLEILLAMQFLHQKGIIHRDIKPENVFLQISGHVKLGDFTASTYVDRKTGKTRGLCCTYVTRPPEVWNYEFYSYPVDVWAFGITVYNVITNSWPILHATQEKQVAHVNRGDLIFGSMFTPSAADLIKRAVQPNPESRWTVQALISHEYFKSLKDPFPAPYTPSELLEIYNSKENMLEELTFIQEFVARLP